MAIGKGNSRKICCEMKNSRVPNLWVRGRIKCDRLLRRVTDKDQYIYYRCSDNHYSCHVYYHKSCWNRVTKHYTDDEKQYGAACMTPDCDGTTAYIEFVDRGQ